MPPGSSVAGVTVDSFAPTNATRAARPALRRMAAIGCGCALAGSAVWVALDDPAAAGSRFPACGFHAVTGLWCPGCGLTRGTHHLLRGDLAGAVSSNVFTPLAILAIVVAWTTWMLGTFGREVRNPFVRMPVWAGPVLGGVLLVYGVVRNLPFAAARSLAP